MRLFQLLKDIILAVKSALSKKQNKTWVKLGTTTGTLKFSVTSYTELNVFVIFGGVQVSQIVHTSMLTSSVQTIVPGYYGNSIYVQLTKTTAKISQQPSGYTGELTIYAR